MTDSVWPGVEQQGLALDWAFFTTNQPVGASRAFVPNQATVSIAAADSPQRFR